MRYWTGRLGMAVAYNKCLRSMIFVPGFRERFITKARDFDADAIILDLEDSVPAPFKSEARAIIRRALDSEGFDQQVFVRVNPISSGLLLDDLVAVLHEAVDGFMCTKVNDERDIVYLDNLLRQLEMEYGFPEGRFRLCPLIETGRAVLRAYEIATASPRVVALAFGGEDYLTDLDGLHKEHGASLLMPRSWIVIAARAAGVEVIDTPYLAINDLTGYRREADLARELGFSGSLVIHPSQIPVANAAFSPSELEIREALRIRAAIEESRSMGSAVALLDGGLIGPPMLKRAERVLEKLEKIRRTNSKADLDPITAIPGVMHYED